MTFRRLDIFICLSMFVGCAPTGSSDEQASEIASSTSSKDQSAEANSLLNPAEAVDRQSLNDRAEKLIEEFHYDEAERLLEDAVNAAEARDILDRVYTESLSFLGRLQSGRGQYAKAEPRLRRALEIDRQLDEESDEGASEHFKRSLSNLASVITELGNVEEAVSLSQKDVEVTKRLFGETHPEVAIAINNLGVSYRKIGKLAEAEDCHLRALQIREATLAPDAPQIAMSLQNLAMVYEDRGKASEAKELYERAISIQEQARVPNKSRLAISINNLAFIHRDQGNLSDARALFNRSLRLKEEGLGENHPSVASTLFDIADLDCREDHLDAAIPLINRSLGIQIEAFGSDSPKHFSLLGRLAEVEFARGEFKKSEDVQRQSMSIAQLHYGDGDGMVAAQRRWIAWCLTAQGNIDAANQIREISNEVLQGYPVEDPERRDSLRKGGISAREQADIFLASGRYFDAFDRYDAAGNRFEMAEGLCNEETARCRDSMASSLRKLGCEAGAKVFENEATSIRAQLHTDAGQ